jgi:hypothetical protein
MADKMQFIAGRFSFKRYLKFVNHNYSSVRARPNRKMPAKPKRLRVEEARLISWYKWEFLRRNAEYRRDYEGFVDEFRNWFDKHGYWYDQTVKPWGRKNFRYFATTIAPKGRIICERWEIRDPYSPDWEFTKTGAHYYKPHEEVSLPTDCSKEAAGELWDLSNLVMSWEELEHRLAEHEAARNGPPPDHQLSMAFDLRRSLPDLLQQAEERITSRKRRYDRTHPEMPKPASPVRRRLDLYETYLRIWDQRQKREKFDSIGALVFPGQSLVVASQRAKDGFARAEYLINGGYKELR